MSRRERRACASAGNRGPGCATVQDPIGIYDASFSVAAHDAGGSLAGFSSRGPSMGTIFTPAVVAPGEEIVSTLGNNSFLQKYYGYFELTMSGKTNVNNDYVALDGTSMAA